MESRELLPVPCQAPKDVAQSMTTMSYTVMATKSMACRAKASAVVVDQVEEAEGREVDQEAGQLAGLEEAPSTEAEVSTACPAGSVAVVG